MIQNQTHQGMRETLGKLPERVADLLAGFGRLKVLGAGSVALLDALQTKMFQKLSFSRSRILDSSKPGFVICFAFETPITQTTRKRLKEGFTAQRLLRSREVNFVLITI